MNRFTRWSRCSRWSVLLLLLGFLPSLTFALGFGEVKLHSYIDEPMDAEIELLGAESYEPERILVSLASAAEFKRAGLARPFLLSQLQFQVLRTAPTTLIRVSSHEPIRQPYLEFLIDLSWPGGRLVRGYTLLLDPAPPGTVPLHERRPPIVSRGIKENTINRVNTLPANTAINTFSQNTMQYANTQSNGPLTPSNSHQQRFEKLFDERGELNTNGEVAPMTIVSALPETTPQTTNVLGSVNPSQNPGQNQNQTGQYAQQGGYPANNGVNNVGYQNPAYIPQGVQQPHSQPLLAQAAAMATQSDKGVNLSGLDKLSFTFDKIQWLLICIALSILLLCVTLIVILARRNKIKINDIPSEAMREASAMQSYPNATSSAHVNFVSPYAAAPHTAHGAHASHPSHTFHTSQAGIQFPPTSFAENNNDRHFQEELKLNTPIPNEMTMKLELARNYFEIGEDENALVLLEDVAVRGTEWEKQTAQRLLAEKANAG